MILLLILCFQPSCSPQRASIRIPSVVEDLASYRMRIIQDITIATLIEVPITLPYRLFIRQCHQKNSCALTPGPALWEVFDKEQTIPNLRSAGVIIQKQKIKNTTKLVEVPGSWPVAASQLEDLIANYELACICGSSTMCSFGSKGDDFLKLIPDTDKAMEIVKDVNYAFQSARTFRKLAGYVVPLFMEKSSQLLTIVLHWCPEEFLSSIRDLQNRQYFCHEMLKGMEAAVNRAHLNFTKKIHFLVVGEDVPEVKDIEEMLTSCDKTKFYELHPIKTLLSKNESQILTNQNFIVQKQLDFEVALRSDVFLGSPFSPFSVLVAYYRFYSHSNPATIMTKLDVKNHLANLYSVQFPYTTPLEAKKTKCTIAFNSGSSLARFSLRPCVTEESVHQIKATARTQKHSRKASPPKQKQNTKTLSENSWAHSQDQNAKKPKGMSDEQLIGEMNFIEPIRGGGEQNNKNFG